MVAEGLDESHDFACMEYRDSAAKVWQVPDAAFAEIGVVHKKDVARPHRRHREIARHRIRHGGIGPPRELAASAIKQADAVVVRLPDHGAARRALDGVLDLRFDRVQGTFDNLQHDRIDCGFRLRKRAGACASKYRGLVHRRISRSAPIGANDQDSVRVYQELLPGKDDGRGPELFHHHWSFEPHFRR